jgi:hypothetical protein
MDVGTHGLVGKVLAGWNLLHSRRIENDIGIPQDRSYASIVPDVADPEFQKLLEIPVDDFVGCRRAMLEIQSHEMLLGFVAGKYNNFRGFAHFVRQQTANEGLAEGSCPTRDQDALPITGFEIH